MRQRGIEPASQADLNPGPPAHGEAPHVSESLWGRGAFPGWNLLPILSPWLPGGLVEDPGGRGSTPPPSLAGVPPREASAPNAEAVSPAAGSGRQQPESQTRRVPQSARRGGPRGQEVRGDRGWRVAGSGMALGGPGWGCAAGWAWPREARCSRVGSWPAARLGFLGESLPPPSSPPPPSPDS